MGTHQTFFENLLAEITSSTKSSQQQSFSTTTISSENVDEQQQQQLVDSLSSSTTAFANEGLESSSVHDVNADPLILQQSTMTSSSTSNNEIELQQLHQSTTSIAQTISDPCKSVRDVVDIVSEYVKDKGITVAHLITVTSLWPTTKSTHPPVLSPLSPSHPYRACKEDFLNNKDIIQLIGLALLLEYIKGDDVKNNVNLLSKEPDIREPLMTNIKYAWDSEKTSSTVPGVIIISYSKSSTPAPARVSVGDDNDDDLELIDLASNNEDEGLETSMKVYYRNNINYY